LLGFQAQRLDSSLPPRTAPADDHRHPCRSEEVERRAAQLTVTNHHRRGSDVANGVTNVETYAQAAEELRPLGNSGTTAQRGIAEGRLPIPGGDELGTIQELGVVEERSGEMGTVEHRFEEVRPVNSRCRRRPLFQKPGERHVEILKILE
jgi:hypothetical protein